MIESYHAEFMTATIRGWRHLLANDEYKICILKSLNWLVQKQRCEVYAFVIMPNHIHLLWKINEGYPRTLVQGALLSYTAHEFKKSLSKSELDHYRVESIDRKYQFWKRACLVKECYTEEFLEQKLDYIHDNPLQNHWQLSKTPESYYWSSAAYYIDNKSPFDFISHYKD